MLGVVALLAYGLGCFCSAYYLVRWRTGLDIRTLGSGTAGARNAGRILGKAGFVLTFLGDLAKGALAIGLAQALAVGAWGEAVAFVAVVLGHLFPLQLGFRGGKGVATAYGALLILQPWVALACLVSASIGFAVTRSFTLAGVFAFVTVPLLGYWLGMAQAHWLALILVVVLLLFAHRQNTYNRLHSIFLRKSHNSEL